MIMQTMQDDYKAAMKARNEEAVSAYRMFFCRVLNAEIDNHGPFDEEGVLKMLGKEVKQRETALVELRKSNRTDIIEREERQLALLKGYLPAALTEEDVRAVVSEVMAEGAANMGEAMKKTLARLGGRADGKMVSAIVAEALKRKQ